MTDHIKDEVLTALSCSELTDTKILISYNDHLC